MLAVQRANLAVYPVQCGTSGPKNLKAMAAVTGGRFYRQYTDLPLAITDALQDVRCSYQLSFMPAAEPPSPIHRINLATSQRAIRLIYPQIYVEPVLPHKLALRLKAAEVGLATPLKAEGMFVDASVKSTSINSAMVTVFLSRSDVASGSIVGSRTALLDVIYAYYDHQSNRMPNGTRDLITIDLGNPGAQSSGSAYSFSQRLAIPPGAAVVRIVVRNADSGAIGSVALPIRKS